VGESIFGVDLDLSAEFQLRYTTRAHPAPLAGSQDGYSNLPLRLRVYSWCGTGKIRLVS
jgi:hypothetical protein